MKKTKILSIAVLATTIILALLIALVAKSYAVTSVIGLDVNPSIEINLSSSDRVLSVSTLNEDAKKVVGDMDLKGTDVNTAINALIGSMVQNGYLTQNTNSVLINVESEDDEKEDFLNNLVSQNIQTALQSSGLSGAVLQSEINSENTQAVSEIATDTNISNGKAVLIDALLTKSQNYTKEELALLNITELSVLLEEIEDENISIVGAVNKDLYITYEEALLIAKTHAGASSTAFETYEFDIENGKIVYEIEFHTNTDEYDYYINALTGEIIHFEKEVSDKVLVTPAPNTSFVNPTTEPVSNATITLDEALLIAKNHANVSEITLVKNELDFDDNIKHYEIEFYSNNVKYEYDIHAENGTILSFEKDLDDDIKEQTMKPSPAPVENTATTITSDEAVKIAKNHAGVVDVYDIDVELDNDDNKLVYEIDFKSGITEYEYEINATNGAVLHFEHEIDD